MSVVWQGDERIIADRMWRNDDCRREFEKAIGLTDEHSEEYHTGFIDWAAAQIRCPYLQVSGPGSGCRYPKCHLGCLGRQ